MVIGHILSANICFRLVGLVYMREIYLLHGVMIKKTFQWTGEIYAEDLTGKTPITDKESNILDLCACPLDHFQSRKMEFATFIISGNGTCEE